MLKRQMLLIEAGASLYLPNKNGLTLTSLNILSHCMHYHSTKKNHNGLKSPQQMADDTTW